MTIDPTLLTAIVGFLGVVVGALLTAVLTDWLRRRADERADRHAKEEVDRQQRLEAIKQTRLRAVDVVAQLRASTTVPRRFVHRGGMFDAADDALIGDEDAIRAYREVLIELQTRLGKGLPRDVARRSARVLRQVDGALRAQETRVRAGEALATVSRDVAKDLFDMDAFADRLLSVDAPPTLRGWIHRRLIDILITLQRLRGS